MSEPPSEPRPPKKPPMDVFLEKMDRVMVDRLKELDESISKREDTKLEAMLDRIINRAQGGQSSPEPQPGPQLPGRAGSMYPSRAPGGGQGFNLGEITGLLRELGMIGGGDQSELFGTLYVEAHKQFDKSVFLPALKKAAGLPLHDIVGDHQ